MNDMIVQVSPTQGRDLETKQVILAKIRGHIEVGNFVLVSIFCLFIERKYFDVLFQGLIYINFKLYNKNIM